MPRGARIVFENAFYHIFNRGVARQNIFLEKEDYEMFLRKLNSLSTLKNYDHFIYAYILMPNHFHLLMQTNRTPLSRIMSSLATAYAMYFNRKYKRVGPLFQNRFKSKLCQKDNYFLGASRYIHLNPIESGLADDVQNYPWSSFQEMFGQSQYTIIDKKEIERLIGASKKEKEAYYKFLLEGIERLDDLKKEYSFDKDIEGNPAFNRISQLKYLRRKRGNKF